MKTFSLYVLSREIDKIKMSVSAEADLITAWVMVFCWITWNASQYLLEIRLTHLFSVDSVSLLYVLQLIQKLIRSYLFCSHHEASEGNHKVRGVYKQMSYSHLQFKKLTGWSSKANVLWEKNVRKLLKQKLTFYSIQEVLHVCRHRKIQVHFHIAWY